MQLNLENISIEKNVPIPKLGHVKSKTKDLAHILLNLTLGDSILVPNNFNVPARRFTQDVSSLVWNSKKYILKMYNKELGLIMRSSNTGLRVWRIK